MAASGLCEAILCQLHVTLKSTQKAYQFDTACIEFRIVVAGSAAYVQDVALSLARCFSVTLKTAATHFTRTNTTRVHLWLNQLEGWIMPMAIYIVNY